MKTNQTMPNRTSMFSVLLTSAVFLATASICFSQPVITSQPAAQATAPGTTATFQVRATGTAPLAYQWQKNPGNGFADLADRTNAALVLTDVQPWDAGDYRVVITNTTGARTSAVARLHVMRFSPVSTKIFSDNFDDNTLTGWFLIHTSGGTGGIKETNGQFTADGSWPGVRTLYPWDTLTEGGIVKNWSLADGQTVEFRAELVALSEDATNTTMMEVPRDYDHTYIFLKGRDFIKIAKWSSDWGSATFWYEKAPIRNTNIVVAIALTRAGPNVVLTARVLDKENPALPDNLWVKMTLSSSRQASPLRVATGSDASCRLKARRRRSPACCWKARPAPQGISGKTLVSSVAL